MYTTDDETKAQGLIRRLEQFDEFSGRQLVFAQYYRITRMRQQSDACWKKVFLGRTELWSWAALGALYHPDQDSLQMVRWIDENHGPERNSIKAARAYVLCDIPTRREEALKIFNEFGSTQSSTVEKYFFIPIPLLLGEMDLAMSCAKQWVREIETGENQTLNTSSEFSELDLLRIVATKKASGLKAKNRMNQLMSHHFLGLLAVAEGKRETAIEHFSKSVERPYPNIDYVWSESFLSHLKEDKAWPRGNKHFSVDEP